jgi:hypothetical protein
VSIAPFFYSSAAGKSNTSLSAHIDIIQLISEYVALRRNGRQFFGLCPFHQEKTPSFAVDPERGVYYCHGCGEGGDAIQFVRRKEGLTFPEALRFLKISSDPIPREELAKRRMEREATDVLAAWAFATADWISTRMRALGQRENIARRCLALPDVDEVAMRDEMIHCAAEWDRLAELQGEILNPEKTIELWRRRREIESMLSDELDPMDEPDTYTPDLTANYKQKLSDIVREMAA